MKYETDWNGLVSTAVLAEWARKAAHHMTVADEMSERWETAKRALKAEPQYQQAPKAERRRFVEINWGMNDAQAAYSWHVNAANRFHQAIIAQQALRQIRNDAL